MIVRAAPEEGLRILRQAAADGLYLTKQNMLVDTLAGDAKPAEVSPAAEQERQRVDRPRVVRAEGGQRACRQIQEP
mgnify:CR=1 FL=1